MNSADSLFAIATFHFLAGNVQECRDAVNALLELEGLTGRVEGLVMSLEG